MNILLGLLFLIASAGIGLKISGKFKKKYLFLSDFNSFLQYIENNLNFLQDALSEVLNKKAGSFNTEFNNFLANLPKDLEAPQEYIKKFAKETNLIEGEEVDCFIKFFEQLGRLDCQTQIEAVKQTKLNIQKFIKRADDKNLKIGKLSTKLGVMCGLALFIIIV